MNAASLSKSDRLRRVLRVLRRGGAYSTRELRRKSDIEAVSATVSELRQNLRPKGKDIDCFRKTVRGRARWYYMLVNV